MRREPHVARCLAASVFIAVGAREPLPSFQAFISGAQEFCYDRLVKDPTCCVDSDIAKNVRRQKVLRPEAEWLCTRANGCYDAYYSGRGARGEDLIWTPEGATCDSPRVLFLHGGSWVYGSPWTNGYPSLASKLASLTGSVMMVADYPLVPVGNFSTIMEASYDALVWLSTHGPDGDDCTAAGPAPLLIAGDSSGGGSAVAVLLTARANPKRWPQLAGAFLYSPWTNLRCDTPTYYYNAFGTAKSKDGKVAYSGDIVFQAPPRENARAYLLSGLEYVGGYHAMLTDPIASPFYADPTDFQGLPPILVTVSNTESIAGDSIVLANKASQGGVQVHMDVYPGMWHVFPMYSEGCGSGQTLWQAATALNRTGEFVEEVARVWRQAQALVKDETDSGIWWPQACNARSPQTWIHYGVAGDRTEPWIPLEPIQLICHATCGEDLSDLEASASELMAEALPRMGARDAIFFFSGFATFGLMLLAISAVWPHLCGLGSSKCEKPYSGGVGVTEMVPTSTASPSDTSHDA